jgi:PAS domain S-box-containing protein
VSSSPVRDDSGTIIGAVAIARDITDRKRVEEQFYSERELLQTIIDSVPAMISIYDPQIKKISLNKAFFQTTGWTAEDLQKTNVMELVYPDPAYRNIVSEFMKSLSPGFKDIQMATKSGSIIEASWANVPLPDGRQVGIGVNITERKQNEQKLTHALEKAEEGRSILNALMENIPMGVTIADAPDVNIRMVSNFGQKNMERASEELAGISAPDHPSKWGIWHADGVTPGTPQELPLTRAVVKGETVRNEEWIVTRSDGTLVPILCNAAPIVDKDGKVTGGVVGWQDISEQRRARMELQRRTEELAAANRDLESFSYSVSHDLRNPLRTISGFAEFLREDYANRLDDEGRDYLRRIDDGVWKMQNLIDDMLSLSRVGRQEMYRDDVDLSAIVSDYLQELKSTEPRRQAKFVIQDNVYAHVDPRMIHLALENLLRNAWKFTSKKEITRIEFGTTVKDNQTVYFVRDNGVGFDMKFAGSIFEPFTRVHAEKEFGGTGVGLSIVQRVIGRHDGKVWAEGETGRSIWCGSASSLQRSPFVNPHPVTIGFAGRVNCEISEGRELTPQSRCYRDSSPIMGASWCDYIVRKYADNDLLRINTKCTSL